MGFLAIVWFLVGLVAAIGLAAEDLKRGRDLVVDELIALVVLTAAGPLLLAYFLLERFMSKRLRRRVVIRGRRGWQ